MLSVTKQFRTETAHRLAKYSGRCSHLHGHSYMFEVTASSEGLNTLTENGMIVDFKELKVAMHEVLDPWDHALILCEEDPLVKHLPEKELRQLFHSTDGKEPRMFVVSWNPTAENMASYVAQCVNNLLPKHIFVTRVRVWETATSHADWHIGTGYCHNGDN